MMGPLLIENSGGALQHIGMDQSPEIMDMGCPKFFAEKQVFLLLEGDLDLDIFEVHPNLLSLGDEVDCLLVISDVVVSAIMGPVLEIPASIRELIDKTKGSVMNPGDSFEPHHHAILGEILVPQPKIEPPLLLIVVGEWNPD